MPKSSTFSNSSVIKHNLIADRPPTADELQVGEIALWIQQDRARLFTKTITNQVVEINKSIEYLKDLLDVDLTNLKEGSFLVKKGDKFVASNILGSIKDLTDVEFQEPVQARQYLRYDSLLQAFVNVYPSYNLYELLDVDVINPSTATTEESFNQNDKTLYYDHATQSFKTRPRRNSLSQLDDVEIDVEEFPSNKLLIENEEGIWTPQTLAIINDTSPQLGGNLDFNNNYAISQTYKVQRLNVTTAVHNIDYAQGDYWVIQGASIETVPSTILNITSVPKNGQALILMLEIRQSSGQILIGGLENVEYEDGRPINLSGEGKTDLITVLITKSQTGVVRSFLTAAALNLAPDGEGGDFAERYPGLSGGTGGGLGSQIFSLPSLYDNYYENVVLLLNFEDEVATGKTWTEDKSKLSNTTVVTATQSLLNQRPFGLPEFAAFFPSTASTITITPTAAIELNNDFTLEFFINYPQNEIYKKTSPIQHLYFESDDLSIKYLGTTSPVNTGNTESSNIEVSIGNTTYTFSNALRLFHNQNNRFVHFALVRQGTDVRLYVDGYKYQSDSALVNSPVTALSINNITISIEGSINSIRLTKDIARYSNHFAIPSMRFGLTGGAEDLFEDYIFNTSHYLGEKEIEHEMFSWY